MTGEAKPSDRAAEESQPFVVAIPVEESMEEEKTLMLSNALTELVVDSEMDRQFSGNEYGVKKKVVEIASDIGASGKKVELGKKTEHEEDAVEDMLIF